MWMYMQERVLSKHTCIIIQKVYVAHVAPGPTRRDGVDAPAQLLEESGLDLAGEVELRMVHQPALQDDQGQDMSPAQRHEIDMPDLRIVKPRDRRDRDALGETGQ